MVCAYILPVTQLVSVNLCCDDVCELGWIGGCVCVGEPELECAEVWRTTAITVCAQWMPCDGGGS